MCVSGPRCVVKQRNITAEAAVTTSNWKPCGGARRLVSFGWQAWLESVDYWPMVNINSKTFGGKPELVAVFGCD
jgi:hypothetical protein